MTGRPAESVRSREHVERPRQNRLVRFVLEPFRRIRRLILDLLKQGFTPEKVALAIALGIVLGLFPVLGTTTILCAAVALPLGLNLPLIQTVNYLVYPLQIALIIPFIQAGAWLFGSPPVEMSMEEITALTMADPIGAASALWAVTLHAIVAWASFSVATAFVLFTALVPVLRRVVPSAEAA